MLQIRLIKIPVSSIETALPFYRDILGLKEEMIAAEYGWAQMSSGNLPFALYVPGKGGGNGEIGRTDSVHFAVADEAGLRRRLEAAGLVPDEHIFRGNDGTTYYELADPDGNFYKLFI